MVSIIKRSVKLRECVSRAFIVPFILLEIKGLFPIKKIQRSIMT